MPKTDEDVLRELLHRVTGELPAPPAVTDGIVARHRRRVRNGRMLSIATTGLAAAAAAAAVTVTRTGPSAPGHAPHPAATGWPAASLPGTTPPATTLPPVSLAALQVLDRLSVAAARSPRPAGRPVHRAHRDPAGTRRQLPADDRPRRPHR